jgi:hypothetical protein
MSNDLETKSYKVEIVYEPQSGKILSERWYNELGWLDRPGDLPADIESCPERGIPIAQTWHNGSGNGPHRVGDLPARVTTRSATDVRVAECFLLMGNFHRDGDQPAVVFRTDDGALKEISHWRHGKLHRDPKFGPAEMKYDSDSGLIISKKYWVNGIQVAEPNQLTAPKI